MVMRGISSIGFLDLETNQIITSGISNSDSLAMKISLELETLYANVQMEGTMSGAWSLGDCEVPLANRIASINVISDTPFNNIPAGQSLNSIFQVFQSYTLTPFTIEEFIQEFNETAAYFNFGYDPFLMWFTQKPAEPIHRFTVSIVDDSGNSFAFTTDDLTWN